MSDENPLGKLDPSRVFARLVELGEFWADAHAGASILEETEKPLLAKLTLARMGNGKSRAQAETEALATPDYEQHVRDMVEARRKANVAKVRHTSAMVWAELLRSASANRRAEMQLGAMVP